MNQLGIDNLTTVATNAVVVANDLVDAAKDGIQLSDTLIIFKDLGKIQEIANKAKQALAELKDLSPDETDALVTHVNQVIDTEGQTVTIQKIKGSLRLVARSHRAVAEAIDIVAGAKELFA